MTKEETESMCCESSHLKLNYELDHYEEHLKAIAESEALNTRFRLKMEGVIDLFKYVGWAQMLGLLALLLDKFGFIPDKL